MAETTRREAMQTAAAAAAAVAATPLAATAAAQAPEPIAPYRATLVQARVLPTFDRDGAFLPDALTANIKRVSGLVDRGAGEVGARLYVFSEFCLQLQQGPLTARDWMAAAIQIPGPQTDVIARAAQRARAYVSINPVEAIPGFPGRYFLSGLIIDSSGDIVVNYRKLYDLSNKTRPTDILDAWLARFGADSLFPVADTAIGRLAAMVALDVAWPEMTRSLMFKGAEVIVNPTASRRVVPSYTALRSPGSPDERDPLVPTMLRRVRAYENMVYMLSCNMGPVGADESAPLADMQPSEVVDYRGNVLAASKDSAEGFITATLDIEALRAARCTPGPLNPLAQLQASLHAPGYRHAVFARPNRFADHPIQQVREHEALQRRDIDDLIRRGVLKAPSSMSR